MNITAQEAQVSKIFIIENGKVEETNLHDFVMISAEETTSPRGVEKKVFIEKDDEADVYQVLKWTGKRSPAIIATFSTEEDAENYLFEYIYKRYFETDDQRDTVYYYTYEDAFSSLIERIGEDWNTSEEVTLSILRKKEMLENIRTQRIAEAAAKHKERISRIAAEYANLIQKLPNETYKQTAQRLKQAIGERIESAVFHQAVKIIRSNNKSLNPKP